MNVKKLNFWMLVCLVLTIQSCTQKKTVKTMAAKAAAKATAVAYKNPQEAMLMLATNDSTQKTLPSANAPADITTKAGYLGKKIEDAAYEKALEESLNDDYKKKVASTSTYTDFKFEFHNVSGVTLYATCFAYIKPRPFNRWRWRKTEVVEVLPGSKAPISVHVLDDYQDKSHVFGILGVFPNRTEAENSTYELLQDENKLDLDLLSEIDGKTVVVGIERYGFREPFYDYDFVDNHIKPHGAGTELDFFVQNQTGKPCFISGFIYTKKAKGRWIATEDEKDDMSVWRFYKTKVLRLEPGQTGYIDVDSIIPKRDREFVRGYLGVFDENHEQDAHNKTFELLADGEKINLGLLTRRHGRTIILEVESYGVANDIIDFTVKPIRWIDFKKIVH